MDKEAEEKIIQVCQSMIKMLEFAFQGFRRLTEESLKKVEETKVEVENHSAELKNLLISKSSTDGREREWVKPYLSIASSFDRMTYNIEGIVERLRAMIQGQIMFSDRALREVNDIFQEAMVLLESLPDLVLTQQKSLAQHIGEQVRSVFKILNRFSDDHEERLMQGVCMPKSSPMYLGILESLKGVIAHTLEVSGKIVSLSSKSSSSSVSPPPPP
jgi:Na+/phosphate symporter